MSFINLIAESLLDTIKLLPFLFLTYLLMEYIEHKASDTAERVLKRSGQAGPLLGGALGLIPMCGFSSAAAGFYGVRLLSMGTIISVFLATSDEMIATFIATPNSNLALVPKILLIKFVIAVVAGLAVDAVIRVIYKKKGIQQEVQIEELCKKEGCHCHTNIVKSALTHTAKIALFVLIFNFVMTFIIQFVGEYYIKMIVVDKPIIGNILASIVGLIPNCASSVMITDLYLKNSLSAGAMMSGLLINSGVALAVLFRTNTSKKNTFIIIGILFAVAILSGVIIDLTPISNWLSI